MTELLLETGPTIIARHDGSAPQPFSAHRLDALLSELSVGLDCAHMDVAELVAKVVKLLPQLLTVYELLDLVAESIAARVVFHPDHSILAGRVIAKKLQTMVGGISFSENVTKLAALRNARTGKLLSNLSPEFLRTLQAHSTLLNALVQPSRDFDFSFFGIKTLEKLYLLKQADQSSKSDAIIAETPQFMFLRVAIGIHGDDMAAVSETYHMMSQRYFIHALPTLYNAGSTFNYLSSCFLMAMEDDSIDGIFKTLHTAALVSKASGGIGLHVHNIRGNGSHISSTNGTLSGLVPMLKVFNDTARYVDQGGNKRPGAFAVYLEPWHSDVFAILDLKKNHGKEEMRARDLFFGLWIPDLFMQRVKADANWSLFSPDDAPGLADCYGADFVRLYEQFEARGLAVSTIKAQKLWHAIIESQTETGGPYMLYKDSCNAKSNQQNLGVIKSSNLCCEIVEYSSPQETAVCNLGSLALPSFLLPGENEIKVDYVKLHRVTKILTKNLDKVIDVTKYPVPSAARSNMRNRPIAVGVQGLADMFAELRLPFDSEEARTVNIQIFETIYHAAVEASLELAQVNGAYSTFTGSPASRGLLQFDLWHHKPSDLYTDWDTLKAKVVKHGLRNSLLVAPMPTASTSQILGFNECFEPYTSNIYSRRVLSGEYQIVNKYLLRDLIDLGIWNSAVKDRILMENGSIQNIEGIPHEIKQLYRTVWEIPQRNIIDMAADRAKFIDQLQSMNIYMQNPTLGKLTSCHFYGWEKGLKTGMYYLRTQAAARAIQFTVDQHEASNFKSVVTKTLKRKHYARVNRLLENDKEGEGVQSSKRLRSSTPDEGLEEQELYDIHDATPVACDIRDPGNCEACSG